MIFYQRIILSILLFQLAIAALLFKRGLPRAEIFLDPSTRSGGLQTTLNTPFKEETHPSQKLFGNFHRRQSEDKQNDCSISAEKRMSIAVCSRTMSRIAPDEYDTSR